MSGLRGVTLTVRFLCELAMLAALAYRGFAVGEGVGAWVLGIGAPLLAAVVWGALVAPKARWPVPIPVRVVIELVLFGAAAGALAVADQPLAAVVLGVAALTTSLLNAFRERSRPPLKFPASVASALVSASGSVVRQVHLVRGLGSRRPQRSVGG